MPVRNPIGGMKYWLNGQPFQAVVRKDTDGRRFKFWINGQPEATFIPSTGQLGFFRLL